MEKVPGRSSFEPGDLLKGRSCVHRARRLKLFNHCVTRKKRATRQEKVLGTGEVGRVGRRHQKLGIELPFAVLPWGRLLEGNGF